MQPMASRWSLHLRSSKAHPPPKKTSHPLSPCARAHSGIATASSSTERRSSLVRFNLCAEGAPEHGSSSSSMNSSGSSSDAPTRSTTTTTNNNTSRFASTSESPVRRSSQAHAGLSPIITQVDTASEHAQLHARKVPARNPKPETLKLWNPEP